MIDTKDIAWMAGIIEGEGSSKHNRYVYYLGIVSLPHVSGDGPCLWGSRRLRGLFNNQVGG